MRILHTSDWHLGRSFGDHRLLDQQMEFIDWLVALTASEEIDLVAIAGDLHDRAQPPVEAVKLLSDAIRRLRATGAEVVAIAGNHDSAERVGAFDGLVDAGGVLMRGGYGAAAQVDVREYADGPLAIVATPFLEPLLAPPAVRDEISGPAQEGRSPRLSHEAVLRHALDGARASIPEGMRSLVLSHAFVTGAAPSDSERGLTMGAVGNAGMVSAELFDGFDYVALGHLHRPQVVAGHGHIRYSGSPLRYSFGETHQKQVLIADLDREGNVSVTEVPVGVGRGVRVERGRFEELIDGPVVDDAWVRVELTDLLPVADAHRALRVRFPYLVEIDRIGRSTVPGARLSSQRAKVRSAEELARDFWNEISDGELDTTVASILDAAVSKAQEPVGDDRMEEGAA